MSQAAGVITDASALANSSNPYKIAITAVTTVIDVCDPSKVKYSARCVGLFVTAIVAINSPEPISKVAFLTSLYSVLKP